MRTLLSTPHSPLRFALPTGPEALIPTRRERSLYLRAPSSMDVNTGTVNGMPQIPLEIRIEIWKQMRL